MSNAIKNVGCAFLFFSLAIFVTIDPLHRYTKFENDLLWLISLSVGWYFVSKAWDNVREDKIDKQRREGGEK